jgi:hypothetical protein
VNRLLNLCLKAIATVAKIPKITVVKLARFGLTIALNTVIASAVIHKEKLDIE